jgi:hypothetical protein
MAEYESLGSGAVTARCITDLVVIGRRVRELKQWESTSRTCTCRCGI